MTLRTSLSLSVIISFIFVTIVVCSCLFTSNQDEKKQQLVNGTKEGYMLAKKHCSTCHSFVAAGSLDQVTWIKKVLPGMAPNLGIGIFGETDYINNSHYGSGTVSFENWMKIVEYYTLNAPQKLTPAKSPVAPEKSWSIFELKKPDHSIFPFAKTMLVSVDTATNDIYTSDGNTKFLYRWNNLLQIKDSIYLSSPAVSAKFVNDKDGSRKAIVATLGTILPSDISEGQLLQLNVAKKLMPGDTLAKNLPRPVQSVAADFNNDGLTDLVICGFGHLKGGLYWLQQLPQGGYRKNSIIDVPGSIQAVVQDFNNDGWQDLMVLFAHDDESIRLYTNDKKGSFTTKRILTFPPVFGSSSFQLVDFNNDGLMDILYTCGDNSDLSIILKPFHGFYIYLNKGNFNYEQSYFYPINGCTKAVAADFDKDGDLDIATIAFFADFKNNPGEKFLYFEQDKALHFLPHSPPIERNGRWICMDIADYDKDGDLDIILGNFASGYIILKDYRPDWDFTTPFIILENKIKE